MTSIAVSGHIIAQNAHPIHSFSSVKRAGKNPLEFKPFFAIAIIFLGQTPTQSLHPLHFSLSITALRIHYTALSTILGSIPKIPLITLILTVTLSPPRAPTAFIA
jgi:hypothetical protein